MTEESDRIGAFVHGFTYAGHPVASAVAVEVLRIYDEMDIVGRVKSLEPVFLKMLQSMTDHPMVGDASGVGLIGGLEIVANKETRNSFGPEINISDLIEKHARKSGIILHITPGRIAYSPPLVISEEEIVEIGRRTRLALDGAWAEALAALGAGHQMGR
jgi:4-aminobutyrate--pyruvate transaminase